MEDVQQGLLRQATGSVSYEAICVHALQVTDKQNPYQRVFTAELHYCLLEMDGNLCTM